ncbi:MarR family transcriptional regulator [Pseudonocardia alni subsp. carboxydivorans]|uniref:MarR family transcriptional regulator n=1 Tax=Pseudonocardia alni subsp. carboxydivorans TaxID=415010 RepID=A0ABU9AE58_PSEA5
MASASPDEGDTRDGDTGDGAATGGDTGGDLLRLDRQVCFALAVAARNVIALYRPLLEPMGLTHPQYLVMLALWEHSPRSLGELARALALDPGTLSPLLKRLEAAGLVDRRRVPGDERTMAVSLTDAGRALRARAEAIPPAIVARLGMPLPELEELRAVLDRVIDASRS